MNSNIIIAGGGIGGLTAALCLSQKGFRVQILEKSPQIDHKLGAGIQITPNAHKVLDALGFSNAIDHVACEPVQATLRDYKTAQLRFALPIKGQFLERYGANYYHIYRPDLQRVLLDAVAAQPNITLHFGHPLIQALQTDDKVEAHTPKQICVGDVLIGADGIHSMLRSQIAPEHSPTFTGYIAWRATLPVTATLRSLIPPDATLWMGPHAHIVTYYVRQGQLINLVAVQEQAEWIDENWKQVGNLDTFKKTFHAWHSTVQTLIDHCEDCYLWGLFDHPPLSSWVNGSMALLGDACHPMLPFMAQGAAMAIEDGWVLARCLSEPDQPISEALKNYETLRKPRTRAIAEISRNNAKIYHLAPGVKYKLRNTALKLAHQFPALSYRRFDPIYGGFQL